MAVIKRNNVNELLLVPEYLSNLQQKYLKLSEFVNANASRERIIVCIRSIVPLRQGRGWEANYPYTEEINGLVCLALLLVNMGRPSFVLGSILEVFKSVCGCPPGMKFEMGRQARVSLLLPEHWFPVGNKTSQCRCRTWDPDESHGDHSDQSDQLSVYDNNSTSYGGVEHFTCLNG